MYGRPGYGSGTMYGSGAMSGGYGGMNSAYGGYGMNNNMYGGSSVGMENGQNQGPPGLMNTLEGALRPPKAWEVMLRGLHGIMNGFGRLSFLVDENTAAMHFFVSALLTLCDRAGTLYGEVARFLLRLLGWNRRKKMTNEQHQAAAGKPHPHFQPQRQPGTLQLTAGQQALASAWPSSMSARGGPSAQTNSHPLSVPNRIGHSTVQSLDDDVMSGAWRHI